MEDVKIAELVIRKLEDTNEDTLDFDLYVDIDLNQEECDRISDLVIRIRDVLSDSLKRNDLIDLEEE